MTGIYTINTFAILAFFNALGVYGVWHDFGIFNGLSIILAISGGAFAWCAIVSRKATKSEAEIRSESYTLGVQDGQRNRRERRDRKKQGRQDGR